MNLKIYARKETTLDKFSTYTLKRIKLKSTEK
jgi:hypothetical protein